MFEAATKTLFRRKEIVHTNKPLNLEGMIIFSCLGRIEGVTANMTFNEKSEKLRELLKNQVQIGKIYDIYF